MQQQHLFVVLFALASLDAYVNGPKLEGVRSQVLLGFSVASIALSLANMEFAWLAMVLAELAWMAGFAEAAMVERKAKLAEAAAAAAQEQGKPGAAAAEAALPPQIAGFMKQMMDNFKANVSGPSNYLNQPWKLLDSKDGVQIYQSDFPGQKCKFWKVETEITGNLDFFKREIFDYKVRVTWDVAVGSGEVIKTFPTADGLGIPHVLQIFTAPQGGGTVSPRELVDFGLLLEEGGKFIFANASVPTNLYGLVPELPKKVTDVRAFAHPGSGSIIEPIPEKPGKFRYVLVNALDLGGWLPSSIINSATTSALLDSTKQMLLHLERTRPK